MGDRGNSRSCRDGNCSWSSSLNTKPSRKYMGIRQSFASRIITPYNADGEKRSASELASKSSRLLKPMNYMSALVGNCWWICPKQRRSNKKGQNQLKNMNVTFKDMIKYFFNPQWKCFIEETVQTKPKLDHQWFSQATTDNWRRLENNRPVSSFLSFVGDSTRKDLRAELICSFCLGVDLWGKDGCTSAPSRPLRQLLLIGNRAAALTPHYWPQMRWK